MFKIKCFYQDKSISKTLNASIFYTNNQTKIHISQILQMQPLKNHDK